MRTRVSKFCCLTLAAAFILALGSPAANASPKPFSIDAEEAPRSLLEFGRQSTLQILFATEKVKGIVTNAVHGSYEPIDALRLLLKGTPLVVSEKPDGVLVVEPQVGVHRSLITDPNPANNNAENARLAQSTLAGSPPQSASSSSSVAGASSPSSDSDKASLTEIVVTAEKRPERLIDVPQSVTVISGDALANLGATQFRDFASMVPGLNLQTAGTGNTQITLRGVTTGADVSPTVGVYVDDVPYGSSTAFAQGAQVALDVGLFDLDRIEVLRGPQGTLYGASTMGGLIKYVTKLPDATSFYSTVQTGLSDTQSGGINYKGAIVVNAPIVSDEVAVRASAYYSHDGGYIDNVALGQSDVNRSGIYGGRLDFLIKPTDVLTIRIGGFVQDISRDGEADSDYTLAGQPLYGSLDQYRKFEEPFHQQFRLAQSTIDYDFGLVSLTSISSYQSMTEYNVWDISRTYVPLLNSFGLGPYSAVALTNGSTTDKFTQEVRLTSKDGRRLSWVAGGFYTHEASQYVENFELRDLAGAPAPNNIFVFAAPSSYQEYAAFGDLTFHITDALDVTAGVRYAHNKQVYSQFGTTPIPALNSNEGVATYLGDARYHFTPQVTGYFRYATGYRPGGPNQSVNSPTTGLPLGPATFQSDTLRSYELGVKASTVDAKYDLDLAVYDIDWDNIQIEANNDGFVFRVNVPGGATIQGSELTLGARPISGLSLTGTLAYQHAYLRVSDAALGAVAGERLPDVPRITSSLNADYKIVEGGLKPTIGATARYVSDRFASYQNNVLDPQYRLPSYATADVRGGITLGSTKLQAYVHNIFDRRGEVSDMLPQFGPRIGIVQPRTIGMSAAVKF